MAGLSWPSKPELDKIRRTVAEMSGRGAEEVRVVISPYRICPMGAHIDHQGGTVSAMTINKGILLGFVPSNDSQVFIRSGQFKGEVRFSVDENQLPRDIAKSNDKIQVNHSSKLQEECSWGSYARGALYALQSRGNHLRQGITGFLCGSDGLDSSGLSSSAAVGVAYLLALETANNLTVSPEENIEYDRLIENEYLGLKNGILDQSAILLSSYGCLTCMNCKTKEHKLIQPPKLQKKDKTETKNAYKILLAFSGLKQALTNNPGYNHRVAECQEAANVLLLSSGKGGVEPLLSNVEPEVYEAHKESMTFLKCAISSDWIQSHGLKFLFASLHNVGVVLYRNNKMEEANSTRSLQCNGIYVFRDFVPWHPKCLIGAASGGRGTNSLLQKKSCWDVLTLGICICSGYV